MFILKGEEDEVFGMQIPKKLITDNIRNASYYNAYLEMVAKHDRKIVAAEGGKKKSASKIDLSKKPATAKLPKPVSSKQSKPAPAKQSKPVKEKSTKPTPLQKAGKGKMRKVDYDLHRGKGKGIATDEQRWIPVTEDASTGPSVQPEDDISTNIIRDTSSPTDAETCAGTDKTNSERDTEILNIGEEQGEDVANKVNLEEKTVEIDEGQARSDPGKTPESRPPPERVLMKEDQARPTLDKQPNKEHVYVNDKPTEEEPDKANMESEVESMVTVPIHQASSSVLPLSTLVIDLTPFKPVSSTTQAPIFTATIATTTTTLPLPPLPPPPQQQSSSDPNLASFFSALEQVCANFEKRYKLQDKTVQGLSSRVFKLELRDLPHQINQTVNEVLFESGSYRSLPEHVSLYEALEASMEHENKDVFLVKKDKSRKRRQDDQDPHLPPSKEPDQSKKKKYDFDASGSIQTPAQTSSAWKTSDTRDAPSSFQDIPIPDDVHVSNIKDTDAAHLLKIKPRPNWLKPILEEERLKTPELD
ncbi:hypothetical protein Tco_0403855 [Tanacetum coccineum]